MLKKIKSYFSPGKKRTEDMTDDETGTAYLPREKFLVFSASLLLAFCLWFIVNLSRDFTITIELPLDITNISEEMALTDEPPMSASVGISGEGWTLISLYSNPPRISVDVEGREVNLYEQVQQQITMLADVNVTQVRPIFLNLELEERQSREVPVRADVEIRPRERFGVIGEPVVAPSAVTIMGAASRVARIDTVVTRKETLTEVNESRELELTVESPGPGISVSPDRIRYLFEVVEFTEGELRVPVRIRNLPPGQAVTYNPSMITIRYSVPIEQYNDVQNARPFTAYVDYQDIEADTTGLVVPMVERTEDLFNVRLRSFTPRTLSYFNVVREEAGGGL